MSQSSTIGRTHEDVTLSRMACMPYKFGWAFLLAWVFCVFYLGGSNRAADLGISSQSIGLQLVFEGLPVFASVVTLIAVIFLEKRIGSPSRSKLLVYGAPMLAAAGTPLLSLTTPDQGLACVSFCASAVLTGMGSGIMWVLWGEYYASMPQDEREIAAPGSAAVAALLALTSSAMDGWIVTAFAASLPLISGLCLVWALREETARPERRHTPLDEGPAKPTPPALKSLVSMGRTAPGILMTCAFVCIAGGFVGVDAPRANQPILLAAVVFTMALTAVALIGPRRISLPFFYRWMCPALVAGFGGVILFGEPWGPYVALGASIAARFAFCLITQMYFAQFAERGIATAAQAYGWGWIAVHLGDFLGVVVLVLIAPLRAAGIVSPDQVAIVSIILLVVATMFVLDDTRSFRMKRADDEAAETQHAAPQPLSANNAEDARQRPSEPNAPAAEMDEREQAPAEPSLDERIGAIAAAHRLTPRETEVFGLLARGRSIPYIRDELVISRETAATHAKHIYAKLDVHSRQELIDLVAGNPS